MCLRQYNLYFLCWCPICSFCGSQVFELVYVFQLVSVDLYVGGRYCLDSADDDSVLSELFVIPYHAAALSSLSLSCCSSPSLLPIRPVSPATPTLCKEAVLRGASKANLHSIEISNRGENFALDTVLIAIEV